MTHTAGFEEAAKGIITYDPKLYLPLDAYLKRWTPRRIFAPGTTPAYSNWATTLAAYIVQRVSGEEFNAYLDHHIFAPLGRCTTQRSASRCPPVAGARYGDRLSAKPGTAKGFEYITPWPAGSGSVSGTDMARFMLAHLQHGELDGQRILTAQTADMMHDSPLDKVNPRSLIPPLSRMELGFFETNINGREVIGHLGDVEAFHTSLHLFLKEGVGLFISFNSPGKGGAVQGLRTGMFQDFADRYFPDIAAPDGRVDARTSAAHARMMAGNWIASRRADSSFLSAVYWMTGQTKHFGRAEGRAGRAQRAQRWRTAARMGRKSRRSCGATRWAMTGWPGRSSDGKVVRWSYDFASPFEVFDRVPVAYSSGWLLPAMYASLAILLITFLQWPVAAIARRTYKAPHPLTGQALRAQPRDADRRGAGIRAADRLGGHGGQRPGVTRCAGRRARSAVLVPADRRGDPVLRPACHCGRGTYG